MELPIDVIERNLSRGDILLSEFKDIDHQKFFVVMGISEDKICGFFFINSGINRYLLNKKEQLAMQYPLRKADYHFLRYDSFLCASSVQEHPLKSIVEGIRNNRTKIIGKLKDEHISEILSMVNSSVIISRYHKKRYFL